MSRRKAMYLQIHGKLFIVFFNQTQIHIMYKRLVYPIALLAFAFLLIVACRHDYVSATDTGNLNPPPPSSTCSPDSVYFVTQVQPVISSNCTMSGCHDNTSHADGVNLTSYNNIMRYVVPGNAGSSKLYKVMIRTGGERMPPNAPLSSTQLALIQQWINQGALNNNCTGSCTDAVFTYSSAVKPILSARCVGCHNPSSLGGGIDLSTYNAVKTVALSGQLAGAVAGKTGYILMPQNASRLSDCEISQIQKWVDAGALNN